ncbi:GNAT family N-acetyltransferase [Methylobacterium nonmethylotrophicum]|uniref:GNAT family N-acetyltransferase n=1 Tax=Methylobacterium nonmethylotrophicum TaxID=1141884 RepID=A0A4Z0NEU7_9HYPH|nr:GNAT family N-acetyltransferase [Methylobacterium nonmethylotrophicum]TGD94702.1 GNAT family N-acetyltransferase [Methylobacterium nonmethylotrophicum]
MDGTVRLAAQDAAAQPAPPATSLSSEVFPGLAAAEAPWRALEAAPGVVMTPYQRFDWVSACAATLPEGAQARPVLLRDAAGRPLALLPLCVRREAGIRVARMIGGRHANFHMPIFAGPEAAFLPAEAYRTALRRAGRLAGADVIHLPHQPLAWDGVPNPLAHGPASPSDAYGLALAADPEMVLKRVLSGDARRKLRQKEKWLVAAHGPVVHRIAADEQEGEAILAAYLAQKAERFATRGIADPFADPAARGFLARAHRAGALELHALCTGGGRILATFVGAVDARRFSGMLTSFDPDPSLARFSPGDLLLQALIRDQALRGRAALDLGVGEARYKASVCDETIRLVDAVLPVSLRGRVYGAAAEAGARLKRRIKRDPRLWALVGRARKLMARPA